MNAAVNNTGTFTVENGSGGNRIYTGNFFNNGSMVVNRRLDVNGPSEFFQFDGSITANSTLAINTGELKISGGTISGNTLVDDGRISVLGASTATGQVNAQGTTELWGILNDGLSIHIQGSSNGGHANVTTLPWFTNRGLIVLESINSSWDSNLSVTGIMRNDSIGTIKINQGSGGTRHISGYIDNTGTLDGTDREYRQIDGNLNLGGGQLLGEIKTLNTAVFINGDTTGEIKLHGASNTLGGTINDGLTVRLRGASDGGHGNTTVDGNLTNQGLLILDTINSNWSSTLTGDFLNDSGGTVQTLVGTGGDRTINGEFTNLGTIDVQQELTITGTGLKMQAGSLTATARTTIDNGSKFEASGGTVTGEVIVRNSELAFLPGSTLAGTIKTQGNAAILSGTINADATVQITGANFGGHAVTTTNPGVVNNGTLELTTNNSNWNTTLDATNKLVNNGTLTTTQGTNGSRTITGEVDNFGQITTPYGAVFSSGSALNMKGGSQSGSALLRLFQSTFTAEAGNITGTLAVDDGAIVFASGSTLTGTLEARGSTTLTGTVNSGAAVRILGGNTGGAATLLTQTGAVNNGTILLDTINSN